MVSVDNRPSNLLLPNLNLDNKLQIPDENSSSFFAGRTSQFSDQTSADKWIVAFAPDNSHFAWRCGSTTIAVIPWSSSSGCNIQENSATTTNNVGNVSIENEADASQRISKPMVVQCEDEVWSVTFGLTPSRPPPKQSSAENGGRRRASLTKCPDFYNFRAPSNRLVLAVGLRNGRIRLYSVYAARFITELIDHKLPIRQIQFRPCVFVDDDEEKDSMILLSASRDSTLKLWNLYDDCNMFKTLEQHEKGEWVMCCSWSPNGRWAASGGTPSSLFVYDANNWTLFKNLKGHLNVVTACQFSPDSALLASSSFDTTLILWDFQKGVQLRRFWHLLPAPRLIYASGANGFHVRSLSFSPDGEHLASVCDDGFLRTWSIFDARDIPEPVAIGAVSNAMCASFSPDGGFLSVGTHGGSVRFFVSYMRVKRLTEVCRSAVRNICHSNDRVQNLPLSKQLKTFLLYEFT